MAITSTKSPPAASTKAFWGSTDTATVVFMSDASVFSGSGWYPGKRNLRYGCRVAHKFAEDRCRTLTHLDRISCFLQRE